MAVITCEKCGPLGTRVVPGSLFCWRHATTPPKVAEFVSDAGQLRWVTTREASGPSESLLAVLVDDRQVMVEFVREAPQERPQRLDLEVRDPANPDARPTSISVPISAAFDAIQAGQEYLLAKVDKQTV